MLAEHRLLPLVASLCIAMQLGCTPARPTFVHQEVVVGESPPGAGSIELVGEPALLDQPPDVKLRLGHYRNDERGIGVVIDRTGRREQVGDVGLAKLLFDGEDRVIHLAGRHGASGRVDYVHPDGRLGLQAWPDGRIAVFVYVAHAPVEAIDVVRIADAEPL